MKRCEVVSGARKWASLFALAVLVWGGRAEAASGSQTSLYLPAISQAVSSRLTYSTGSPIAVSAADATVWVVNPDADSITVMDSTRMQVLTETQIGHEPWSVVLSRDGRRAYVLNRASGSLTWLDAHQHTVAGELLIGPEPISIALSPSGRTAYVSISAADQIAVIDTARMTVTQRIAVEAMPYAVAMSDDGDGDDDDERIFITHLFAGQKPGGQEASNEGREGRVTVIDPRTGNVTHTVKLAPNAHGFPNMLTGIALTPAYAWIPNTRASPALPNGLSSMVFASVAAIHLATLDEDPAAGLPLNDDQIFGSPVNTPLAAIPSPDAARLYVVAAGNDLVEVIDIANPTQPRLVKFLPAGLNPRGLALSADGKHGFVMNYLSRSVTVLDLETLSHIGDITTTRETLPAVVLRGKQLFNSAADPRMTRGGWISCASCHLEGGTDSVTWIFPDGPRQTPPLWNAAHTLPWHWSAALDEPQDVEVTIQDIQHGVGLAPGGDPALLGPPIAGRSADLDALAAFMTQGIRPPNRLGFDGEVDSDVVAGRQGFIAAGCAACHGGPNWTLSSQTSAAGTLDLDGNGMVDAALREVGTYNPADLRGKTGFDIPSLLNIGLTAPYLHDGSLPTLTDVLTSGHPKSSANTIAFTSDEIRQITAFLRAIGPATPPVAGP